MFLLESHSGIFAGKEASSPSYRSFPVPIHLNPRHLNIVLSTASEVKRLLLASRTNRDKFRDGNGRKGAGTRASGSSE
jgi:hypothetical protein